MNERIILNERASLERPAWTSERSTGNFEAFKHRHALIKGKFRLQRNFFVEGKR